MSWTKGGREAVEKAPDDVREELEKNSDGVYQPVVFIPSSGPWQLPNHTAVYSCKVTYRSPLFRSLTFMLDTRMAYQGLNFFI